MKLSGCMCKVLAMSLGVILVFLILLISYFCTVVENISDMILMNRLKKRNYDENYRHSQNNLLKLSGKIKPSHYDLTLFLDKENKVFEGFVEIYMYYDGGGMEISSLDKRNTSNSRLKRKRNILVSSFEESLAKTKLFDKQRYLLEQIDFKNLYWNLNKFNKTLDRIDNKNSYLNFDKFNKTLDRIDNNNSYLTLNKFNKTLNQIDYRNLYSNNNKFIKKLENFGELYKFKNSSVDNKYQSERAFLKLEKLDKPLREKIRLRRELEVDELEFNESLITDNWDEHKFIILHSDGLNITQAEVKFHQLNNSQQLGTESFPLKIKRTFKLSKYDLFVIELMDRLTEGHASKFDISVRLNFTGIIHEDVQALYLMNPLWYLVTNYSYFMATDFQPIYARKVFPCFDEPRFKATFNLTLIHSNTHFALSNMPVLTTKELNGNLTETRFEKSVPLVTYLVFFIICDFQFRETNTSRGTKIRVYGEKNYIDESAMALTLNRRLIESFEDKLDIKYPLPKLDCIGLNSLVTQAMENWGIITFSNDFLFTTEPLSPTHKPYRAMTHEIAHMWFGNLVTMCWWNDIWLNEGLASYFELYMVNKLLPSDNQFKESILEDNLFVMSLDTDRDLLDDLGYETRVVRPVTTKEIAAKLFDTILYKKGQSVINMMASIMGEADFIEQIKIYLKKFQFQCVTTDDFLTSMQPEKDVPYNVGELIPNWIYQPSYPIVYVEFLRNGSMVRISQESHFHSLSNDTQIEYHQWIIPISWRQINNDKTGLVWLKKKQDYYIDIPNYLSSKEDDEDDDTFVIFNSDKLAYARFNYPESYWYKIHDLLMHNISILSSNEKCTLLDDAFSLAKTGHLNYSIPLSLSYILVNELHEALWKILIENWDFINDYIDQDNYYLFKEYTNGILKDFHENYNNSLNDGPIMKKIHDLIANCNSDNICSMYFFKYDNFENETKKYIAHIMNKSDSDNSSLLTAINFLNRDINRRRTLGRWIFENWNNISKSFLFNERFEEDVILKLYELYNKRQSFHETEKELRNLYSSLDHSNKIFSGNEHSFVKLYDSDQRNKLLARTLDSIQFHLKWTEKRLPGVNIWLKTQHKMSN